MIKSKFKRVTSLFLATLMCVTTFAGIGSTTAYAALGEKADVYMVDFPRDGDANYDGVWGHSNLTLKNGWHTGRSNFTNLKAIGSYSGNVAYCIEPGISLKVGQTMNKYDENYFNNLASNGVISGDEIRLFVGRILQYGYRGTISTSWRSQNEAAANSIAQAYATQLLIWETVIGERDVNFNHVAASGCSNVKDVINAKHPLRNKIFSYYNSMVQSVQNHAIIPSFCNKSSGSAKTIELEWNGSKYTTTLTDSNNVLSKYNFKASISAVSFSVNGNKLTVSMDTAPSKEFTITATKKNAVRRGVVVWSEGKHGQNSSVQDVVSYASYIKDSMVAELTDMNRNLMMSIDIVPVPTDEAVKEAENRLLGVETNITNWQRRQNANNNFSATVPYDMEQQKKEMKEFLDDLTTRDQRMMFAVITMVITADSKEQLENDTEALLTTARKHLCQFATLRFQQVDGLNTVMPFGTRKIDAFRTLTTESLSVFIPFRVQDIFHENGIYYGQNVISKNMIIADRKQLLNGNSFILGVSGGGKSFAAKGEIINQVLSSDADIIIIDPEREYSQLVNAMGGEVINISATSDNHINAMDMNKDYGDGANPVILKSEFIMSLCEQLIGGTNLGAKQKSIIDRCTASVYRSYQQNDYQGHIPTLQDFRAELLQQDEPEAKELALAIELFTHGSLNTFAKQTNVDTNNRLICYDILDLGKQLMPIGMLVVLDSILNRITQNRAKGKNTFIFIDEIYLLFQHEYSANFLFTLWKRVRKYGAYASGITQNVDDLLQSHTARTMLANSEFIIMLNQASTDRLELAKLLNISDLQMSYITNVEAGHGLIKVGSSLVPFANKFPKNTKLYKLMTTKPGEA